MASQGTDLHFIAADLPSLACGLVLADPRRQGRAEAPVLDLSGEQWLAQNPSQLPGGRLHTYAAVPYALGLWQHLEPRLGDWLELLKLQAMEPLLIPPLPGVDMLLRCLCLAEALERHGALTVLLPAPAEALALLELARTGPALVETLLEPLLLWWDQTRQSFSSLEVVLRLRLPPSTSLRLDAPWRARLERMAELLAPHGPWQLSLALECADPEARLLRQRLSCTVLRGFPPTRLGLHGPAAESVLAARPPWWPQELVGVALGDVPDVAALQAFLQAVQPSDRQRIDGATGTWRLPMAGVNKAELDVRQIGSVLVLISGGQRRLLDLPEALQGRRCSGARLENGWLELRFA